MVIKETLEKIFENYARLPDEDCSFILQNFLSEALESDTIFEWELAKKLMILSDPARETFTKTINKTIKNNLQQIGGKSVAAWILEYLKKYDGVARNPNTFFEFCSRSPEIQKLAKRDQIKLMRIFRMYDYMLVEPIQDLEYPIENIFRFPMRLDSTPAEISAQVQSVPQGVSQPATRTISEKLPLRDLLRKYPAVGEQNITGGQLKLAHFDRPVRPSVRNWIYDYTSQLGQERHDSMQRMKYLFSSLNGKNLTSPDREKLGIILKSFDENVPLSVDASRNEIVFEVPKVRPFPSGEQVAGIPQGQTFRDSSKPDFTQKPAQKSFIRPYPQPAAKPPTPPKPIQNDFVRPYKSPESKPAVPPQPIQSKIQNTQYNIPNTEKIQFVNPYPAPGTHEIAEAKTEMAGEAPVKLKGFSEGVSKDTQGSTSPGSPKVQPSPPPFAKGGVPQSQALKPPQPKPVPQPSKPYAPSRPKNVIYPHYGAGREKKPEPRIEGNIVDLSEKQ